MTRLSAPGLPLSLTKREISHLPAGNQLPVATTIANGPILVVEKKVINATEVSLGSENRFTLHTVNT